MFPPFLTIGIVLHSIVSKHTSVHSDTTSYPPLPPHKNHLTTPHLADMPTYRGWSPRSEETPNNWQWQPSSPPSRRNGTRSGERPSEYATGSWRPASQSVPFPSPPASGGTITPSESPRNSQPTRLALQQPSPRRSASPAPSYYVKPGIIMNFPAHFKTGENSDSSLLRGQPWVNKDAPGHPVLVWDTYRRGGEQGELIARCLPMTSFGGLSIEEKYPYKSVWKVHLRYVPIMQKGVAAKSATNMPSLALADDESMSHQTYAHLDHFFEIEARHLAMCGRTSKSNCSVYLTDAALDVLV